MNLKVSRVIHQRAVRLISNANHKPPVLEALAPTYGALRSLEALESVTSGRQEVQQRGLPGIAPEAMATGYGYSYINAAFAYRRPSGNRFNPKDWGAWYSGFKSETAQQEVAYHLTRAMEACGADFDNETRYVELLSDFDAEFVELRGVEPTPECLHEDTKAGYPHGQKLAGEIRGAGLNGIVYPSVRHKEGTCIVAFWPGLIQNFQIGETLTFKWEGDPAPKITKASET